MRDDHEFLRAYLKSPKIVSTYKLLTGNNKKIAKIMKEFSDK